MAWFLSCHPEPFKEPTVIVVKSQLSKKHAVKNIKGGYSQRTIRRKTTIFLKIIFNSSKKQVKNEGEVGTILKKESLGGNPGSFLIRTL
jgi:hypothetical protein